MTSLKVIHFLGVVRQEEGHNDHLYPLCQEIAVKGLNVAQASKNLALFNRLCDKADCSVRIFMQRMLPNPDYCIALTPERPELLEIAAHILFYLLNPVIFGQSIAPLTEVPTVPKIAIHED